MNLEAVDKFGKDEIFAEIFNEHMHARISHHRVDDHYVDDMCGLFFETRIDYGNMVSVMFDEALKVEVAFVAARYETIEIAHEAVHDLATTNDQEEDKVIEDFLMRISTINITVEVTLHTVGKKAREGRGRGRSSH